jgi:hypothetical protein
MGGEDNKKKDTFIGKYGPELVSLGIKEMLTYSYDSVEFLKVL